MLNTPNFATAKEWITDRYDNLKVPGPHHFKVNGKPEDTKSIVFPSAPRINVLATSSDDWFFRNLAESDSLGGFMARWTILQAQGKGRDVAIPKTPDAAAVEPLAGRLAAIGKLSGSVDISGIEERYTGWYSAAKRRFEAQPNKALASAYFNRHRGLILKLAVVFEASQSATLKVSVGAWERAVEFALQVEQCIFKLLLTGMNSAGYDLTRIADRVKQAGPEGLPLNMLTRAFQTMPDREKHIKTLRDSGTIHEVILFTGGRNKKVFKHADFQRDSLSSAQVVTEV
jgi:hypothetical protein